MASIYGFRKCCLLLLLLPAVPAAAQEQPLPEWIMEQEARSWKHLRVNISPEEPKAPGGPAPRRGVVVAALSKKDPDYYFHWVRDSAIVMLDVARALNAGRAYAAPAEVAGMMKDFLELSRDLQRTSSPHGLGEPRFNVDSTPDTLAWSRPQYDGPALRALAIMEYLPAAPREQRALALKVLKTDLDFTAANWRKRGFDIWEEYRAENYNTRLAQLAALEKAERWFGSRYRKPARELAVLLDDHWDPARGFLRSQLAIEATDGYTSKKTDLDSAVVVTAMDAERAAGGHSVLDPRLQATVAVLEELFRGLYPINKRDDLGPGYGRYAGDSYYGGNPWYLITAYYARFYYRLAGALAEGRPLAVTKINAAFVSGLLEGPDKDLAAAGAMLAPEQPVHKQLRSALLARGDAAMRRVRFHTPPEGQLYEQFDKNTGQPVSSLGIAWAHAAFIAAALERPAAALSR